MSAIQTQVLLNNFTMSSIFIGSCAQEVGQAAVENTSQKWTQINCYAIPYCMVRLRLRLYSDC